MSSNRFRRTRKLIQPGLQLRLVAAFASVAALACLFQVVLVNHSLLSLARELPADGDRVLAELPRLLVSNLVVTLLVLLPATLVVGVLATHRIAGPVHRFRLWLGQVRRGEEPGPCRLRSGDELQELCEDLNRTFEALGRDGTEREAA